MITETKLTDELTGNSKGGIQTDHGGLEFGDLVVLLLDAVLFIYTAWRSYNFLTDSVPDGQQFMALIGLWGLDIGAIAWSLVWIFGSTAKYQDWISMSFFVIDLSGVVLTSLTDALGYSAPDGAMTEMLQGISAPIIPLIVVANVIAGFIYHMTSPKTKAIREGRKAHAEHNLKMQEVSSMERDLLYAESYILAKQETLDKAQILAEIKVAQDALEKATRARLRDQVGIQASANSMNEAPGNAGSANALKAKLDALKTRLQSMIPTPASEPAENQAAPRPNDKPQLSYGPVTSLIDCKVNKREIHKGMELEAAMNSNGFFNLRLPGEAEPFGELGYDDIYHIVTGVRKEASSMGILPIPIIDISKNGNGNGNDPHSPS